MPATPAPPWAELERPTKYPARDADRMQKATQGAAPEVRRRQLQTFRRLPRTRTRPRRFPRCVGWPQAPAFTWPPRPASESRRVFLQSKNAANIKKQPNAPFKCRDGMGRAIKL